MEHQLSQLHDHLIRSYSVDFEKRTLKMITSMEEETAVTEFTGLLAHSFEDVIHTNIIFDLYPVAIPAFIEREGETLPESLPYGFPSMEARTCDEFRRQLEDQQYKVFYIDSSLGLVGYVIARDVTVTVSSP